MNDAARNAETQPPPPTPSLERTLLAILDTDMERRNAIDLLKFAYADLARIRTQIECGDLQGALRTIDTALVPR